MRSGPRQSFSAQSEDDAPFDLSEAHSESRVGDRFEVDELDQHARVASQCRMEPWAGFEMRS